MNDKKNSAIKFRSVLIVLIVCLVGLASVGFYFGQRGLRSLALIVGQTVADSKAGDDNIQTLKDLQKNLLSRESIVAKANSISADSQNYQNQTIKDLNQYAAYADVTISDYNFASSAPSAVKKTTTASQLVVVTVFSPVSYLKLLKFMAAIETNLPKMQISSVNLGRVEGGDGSSVKTDQLTIEVYTK